MGRNRWNAADVANVPVFRPLAASVHEKIADAIRLREVTKNELIFVEDEPAESIYIVARGHIRLYQSLSDGREYTLEHLGPGEVLAIVCLFDGGPYPASAQALDNGRVAMLPFQSLHAIIRADVDVAMSFLRMLSSRLRRSHQRSTELALRSVHERLATTLLRFHEDNIAPARAARLGQLIGASRETVTRALHDFERQGAITLDHGRIRRMDVQRLRSWLQG